MAPQGSGGLDWGLGSLPCVLSASHVDRAAAPHLGSNVCFSSSQQDLALRQCQACLELFASHKASTRPLAACLCCWCSLDCHSSWHPCIPGAQGHFSLFGKQQGTRLWSWCWPGSHLAPGVSLFPSAPWFSRDGCVSPADPAAVPEGDPALIAGPCLAIPLWKQGQTGAEHGQV